MVVLFALLMLVPLAFALADRDPAEDAFVTATADHLRLRRADEPGHAALSAGSCSRATASCWWD